MARAQRLAAVALLPLLGLAGLVAAGSRHLVYPPPADGAPTKVQLIFGLGIPMEVDVSTIVGYVMKCNYNLPYNASYLGYPDYARSRRTTGQDFETPREGRLEESDSGIGRYDVYEVLKTIAGKACLLRAICDAAATPLDARHGLVAQLLHVLLTPSSTREAYSNPTDQEYQAAEALGLASRKDECARAFTECHGSFWDQLSRTR